MKELETHISKLFGVEDREMLAIKQFFTEETLEIDEFFVKQDHFCNRMSFLTKGAARLYRNVEDKEVTQWISVENSFVTELSSFLFQQRSRWNIKAIEPCTIFSIYTEDYRQLHKVVPRWTEIEKNFIASCFVTLENRVLSHLAMTAEKRYDAFYQDNSALFNRIPLQYLASMLGMTPETLSRIRRKKLS